ncbi:helix-turn-helix domain-containing protein [Cryobacterium tagatosivorans]|nr:helix-turn-helix transcriptional regulator [Cryobacterium tagatosivorans]
MAASAASATVARRMEAARLSAGVALLPLAKATGIPRTTLRRHLAGLSDFKVSNVMKIAEHLNIPFAVLFSEPAAPVAA